VTSTYARQTDGELLRRLAWRGVVTLTVETRRWRRTGPVGTAASLKTCGTGDLVGTWHRHAKRHPTGGPGQK
jgi:hypothetical protein